jgi:aminoglycoside/choline kinase family phosphotransferase
MILRDFHAENLLDLPDRAGVAAVGLLDFQLAEMGQPAYDLISLLQDARRDVSPEIPPAMMRRFAGATGSTEASVTAACAALGAQRALRILGAFARLSLHYGKPGYVRLIPRVWGQLRENLAHPGLQDLAAVVDRMLPPPGDAILQTLVDKCGTIPRA